MNRFFPFLDWIKEINKSSLQADALAGLTGAVIVLPQGVAFAMIAGLPPIYGLYTAMVLPIIAALFGSSKHLISGPTTAISIVIFSTVSQVATPETPEFISVAIGITFIAGILQIILGIAKLGVIVNFVSHSVIIGFTAGAALLIATSQLSHFFGLKMPTDGGFHEKWIELFSGINDIKPDVLIVSMTALISAIILREISSKIPHMLLAMIFGGIVAFAIDSNETDITYIGELPKGLPPFTMPILKFDMIKTLAPNAFAIAMLGLIEAVAIARSIAAKSGQRIDGSQEFIGQGLSNIVGSFFSCYAGSGSFTRSGVNYSAGGITPMASIFAALFLVLILSFVAPLTVYLPIPAMAGIIVLVAYNLIDFVHIKKILKSSKREGFVIIITLLATLTFDLEYAIYLGIFFSLVFYLRETSQPRFVRLSPDPTHKYRMFLNNVKHSLEECPQLMTVRIEGELYFGSVDNVSKQFDELFDEQQNHLLIISNSLNLIDTYGAELLIELSKKWQSAGKQIYFCGMKLPIREFLRRGDYLEQLGVNKIYDRKEEAIRKIYELLDNKKCSDCTVKVFQECQQKSVTNVTSLEIGER